MNPKKYFVHSMTRSQAVVGQELLELALVLGVELLREVGGHVGQEAGPEAGGCAQGAGDLVLLLGGADNPRHVDLDVGDLRHEGEHAPENMKLVAMILVLI